MPGLSGQLTGEFKKRFNDDFYSEATYTALVMLSQGMANAKSTDPVKVARAMEGLKFKSFNGDVEMRKSDHQLQQPLFITQWAPVDAKNAYDVEKTGMTFVPVKAFDAYVSSTPTSCQMKRPS
jgi:branched-chain amino acid transport system substrate-binding protein